MNFHIMGLVALNEGKKEKAIEFFELSLKNNENNWETYIKLYELHSVKNIELLYSSLKISVNKWAYLHLLYFYYNESNIGFLSNCICELIDLYKNKKIDLTEDDLRSIEYYSDQIPSKDQHENIKLFSREYKSRIRKSKIEKYFLQNNSLICLDDSKTEGKIVLFTQFFNSTIEVELNNMYCLYKNLSNPQIEEVVLFVEPDCKFENIFNSKLTLVKINQRLSYEYWYEYSLKKYPDHIKVLSNSDIFFDNTIGVFKNIANWDDDILFTCSRRDLSKKGNLLESRVLYNSESEYIMPELSQDCWAFKKGLKKFDKNYTLGYFHCDSKLRLSANSQNIKLVNLFERINCIHLDWRKNKTRDSYVIS